MPRAQVIRSSLYFVKATMYHKDRNGNPQPIRNEFQWNLAARQCEGELKAGTAVLAGESEYAYERIIAAQQV